jgi:hypothetical protein
VEAAKKVLMPRFASRQIRVAALAACLLLGMLAGTPKASAAYRCDGTAPLQTHCETTFTVSGGVWSPSAGASAAFVGGVAVRVTSATGSITHCFAFWLLDKCTIQETGYFEAGQTATLEGWTSQYAIGEWHVGISAPA